MKLTLEEKAARKATRDAARIEQIKQDREDAAFHREFVKMLRAQRQLEAWFPDKLDTVHLAIEGNDQAVLDLVQDGDYWGDPMVAWVLGMLLPNGNEGMRKVVRLLWSGHRRSALEHLPTHHAKDLLRRYGTKPINYPKTITVYRGGFNGAPESVAEGWSWTTDLLTAAFFVGYQEAFSKRKDMQPYLLKATVKTNQIVHVDDERGEDEKVIFGVRNYEVYGTLQDWARWSEQREQRKSRGLAA